MGGVCLPERASKLWAGLVYSSAFLNLEILSLLTPWDLLGMLDGGRGKGTGNHCISHSTEGNITDLVQFYPVLPLHWDEGEICVHLSVVVLHECDLCTPGCGCCPGCWMRVRFGVHLSVVLSWVLDEGEIWCAPGCGAVLGAGREPQRRQRCLLPPELHSEALRKPKY
jgi:hypothetical protein